MSSEVSEWFERGLKAASRDLQIAFRRSRSRVAVGQRGDFNIRVEVKWRTDETPERGHEELLVSLACDRLPQHLSFSAETDYGLDLLTGDNMFDDEVEVRGEATVLAALLDEVARVKVRRLVAWDGRLEAGRLSWRARAAFSAGEITRTLRDVVDLADLLATAKGGICERLARNACADREAGVRLWNLTLLQQHFDGTREATEASHASLTDPSPWVRLAAARFLKDGSLGVLEALVQDGKTPEHAAAEAVALLGARLPAERAGPLLLAAAKGRAGEVRRQAVEELGRLKYQPALGALCVLLERSDPRTAAAAAAALGALADPKAEATLLGAIQSQAQELRVAAARALGAVGTVLAVEPLLKALEGRLDTESRQAIRGAIDAIQSRLAGAEAGQVSLSADAPAAGRLSLAQPSAGPGDLSLTPPRQEGDVGGPAG